MAPDKTNLTADFRPLWSLSVEEFRQLLRDTINDNMTDLDDSLGNVNKYIYGLDGIRKEFGVGHNTAQRLKDTVLRDAVMQAGHGCKIIVDRVLARRLYTDYMDHMDQEGKK